MRVSKLLGIKDKTTSFHWEVIGSLSDFYQLRYSRLNIGNVVGADNFCCAYEQDTCQCAHKICRLNFWNIIRSNVLKRFCAKILLRTQGSTLCNVYFFYLHGDNGSGILNVFETNKHLNTMQNPWVVQSRQHVLSICLLRTTASFIKDNPVFWVRNRSNWTTKCDLWCN